MSALHCRIVAAITVASWALAWAAPAGAQHTETAEPHGIEIAPVAGYRFGGDFFELVSGQDVDLDGAPAVGVTGSVPLWNGLHVEGLVTLQKASFSTPATITTPARRWHVAVDHYGVGGLQEFRSGKVRPFLNSVFGLTRYAADGDNEVRFTIGAGGGVKLFPSRRIGIRLDGRGYWTFVDAEGDFWACISGVGCGLAFSVDVAWQAEFTAGLVFRFP
jgi:hypothetical protein